MVVKASSSLLLIVMTCACTWTEHISVNSSGVQSNDVSHFPKISGNGRYVAFTSYGDNLVSGDTNNVWDVFIRDVREGTTSRANLDKDGQEIVPFRFPGWNASLSANGLLVAFQSDDSQVVNSDFNNVSDIFVRDRLAGTTTRVSVDSFGNEGNARSFSSRLSDDGRYVVFSSDATNLVPGDTNGARDVFVHDRNTGVTTRVNVDSAGNQANGLSSSPRISGDGRYVAFASNSDNLVGGDTNNVKDVFLHDRVTGSTVRVSVGYGGESDGPSYTPELSTNGRSISFMSDATNLVAGDTNGVRDVFLRRIGIISSTTSRVNVDSAGNQANAGVGEDGIFYSHSMSGDGRYIGFYSDADNLVEGDTNSVSDVFIRDTVKSVTRRVSTNSSGEETTGTYPSSFDPSISKDGRYIAFTSRAMNLVNAEPNLYPNVYVKAIQEVKVTELTPNTLPKGATTSVTVTGEDFLPGTSMAIQGTTITNFVIVDENTITMDVAVDATASSGAFDVTVRLLGTGAGPYTGSASQCLACVIVF